MEIDTVVARRLALFFRRLVDGAKVIVQAKSHSLQLQIRAESHAIAGENDILGAEVGKAIFQLGRPDINDGKLNADACRPADARQQGGVARRRRKTGLIAGEGDAAGRVDQIVSGQDIADARPCAGQRQNILAVGGRAEARRKDIDGVADRIALEIGKSGEVGVGLDAEQHAVGEQEIIARLQSGGETARFVEGVDMVGHAERTGGAGAVPARMAPGIAHAAAEEKAAPRIGGSDGSFRRIFFAGQVSGEGRGRENESRPRHAGKNHRQNRDLRPPFFPNSPHQLQSSSQTALLVFRGGPFCVKPKRDSLERFQL